MKKRIIILLAAAVLMTGCTGEVSDTTSKETEAQTISAASDVSMPLSEVTTESQPEETISLPVFAETDLGEMEYVQAECSELYEAEDGLLLGYAVEARKREGYSGRGYVNGASLPDSGLDFEIQIAYPQHYSLTLCAAADRPIEGVLFVDDVARGSFSLKGDGSFEALKFENIYMPVGESKVCLRELSGECDIDFILLENSKNIYELKYSIPGELCTKSSSLKTAKTYKYLCELYGEAVISGQQCSQGSNAEIDAIAAVTGKYPAIRFGELMGYSAGVDTGDIELAIQYAKNGGLVGYVWNWMKNGSCYADKSGFDIKTIITEHDVAMFSNDKLAQLTENGGISEDCAAAIGEIDLIAEQLKRLSRENIPVIFRPLPEAGSGSFWWGSNKDSYIWLYKLIYNRLTAYHRLDNIIWVWNAQELDWYVGDDYCDIISLDIYDYSHSAWDNQSYIGAMLKLSGLSAKKPIAISECNVLPAPANIAKDNAYWLYASAWSGECVLDSEGRLSEDYISRAEWIVFYNCSKVVALDRLVAID